MTTAARALRQVLPACKVLHMAPTELPVQDFRENLSDHLDRAAFKGERFVVTRNGKPRAALVSIEDLRRLEELDKVKPAPRRP